MVTAPAPGAFLLAAAALGYRARIDGLFELGPDGEMTVEVRLAPWPLDVDGLVVEGEGSLRDRALVNQGFYERMERGFGHFLTPEDLARSQAHDTQDLFRRIPGIAVLPGRQGGIAGDAVRMRDAGGAYCEPSVFLDGVRVQIDSGRGLSLDLIAPRPSLAAVEIYRRPSEVPIQYLGSTVGRGNRNNRMASRCGVILLWTKG